jgi:hypothetical protein
MHTSTDDPTSVPAFLQRAPAWEDNKARLWAMTPARRVEAMRSGELSLRLCLHWVSHRPAECPLVNGEWEFIAARTPETAELDPHAAQRARVTDSLLRRPDTDEPA